MLDTAVSYILTCLLPLLLLLCLPHSSRREVTWVSYSGHIISSCISIYFLIFIYLYIAIIVTLLLLVLVLFEVRDEQE